MSGGGGDSVNVNNTNFPVKTKTLVAPNNNIRIVVHIYSDRLFILVSEIEAGGAGTLVEFRKEFAPEVPGSQTSDQHQQQDIVYNIKVLFGVEKPEILLASRVLGSKILQSGSIKSSDIPILFGFGLKRFDKPLLEEVAEILITVLGTL
jgi:hypothetical protein